MDSGNSGSRKTSELFVSHEAERYAELDGTLTVNTFADVDDFFEVSIRWTVTAVNDGEAAYALTLVRLSCCKDGIGIEQVIYITRGVMMRGLCTELTVLTAFTALAIYDGAEVYEVSDQCGSDSVSTAAEPCEVSVDKERQVILTCKTPSGDYIISKLL